MPTEAPHVFAAWARGLVATLAARRASHQGRAADRRVSPQTPTPRWRRGSSSPALSHQALLHVHFGMRRFAPCDIDRLFDVEPRSVAPRARPLRSRRVTTVIACHIARRLSSSSRLVALLLFDACRQQRGGAAAAARRPRSASSPSRLSASRSPASGSRRSTATSTRRSGRRSPAIWSSATTRKARSSGRARCCSRSIARPFEAALAQAEAQLARGAGAARQDRARPGSATRRSPSSARSRRASSTTTSRPTSRAQAAVQVGRPPRSRPRS